VLADEPTANLDSKTGEQIIELMKKINRELDTTFIFSTHDAKIVGIADHVIRLVTAPWWRTRGPPPRPGRARWES